MSAACSIILPHQLATNNRKTLQKPFGFVRFFLSFLKYKLLYKRQQSNKFIEINAAKKLDHNTIPFNPPVSHIISIILRLLKILEAKIEAL